MRVGPYEILSTLGVGGMGEVYRARDTKLHRDVAIKVLLPAVANDPDRLARFSREAQVLASLNHPNIAHIYGVEEANGVTALVMELVEGEDLSQRIARGPIPIDEALPIARQIAEALEAAHDHGIIHRDLKPANIKLRADGTVKVLDFGLAKAIDPNAGTNASAMNSPTLSIHATQAGIILGTAAYMSPEQARGKVVDRRTDIWALGCVLFEMLTGKRAFPGDDATDTIVAVISKDPEWASLPPATPPTVRRVLHRSLEKDPKRRLDSAAGVRLEIDDVSTSAASAATVKPRRAWLPWGLTAVAAIAFAALAVVYLRQDQVEGALVRFTIAAPFGSRRTPLETFAVSPDGKSIAFIAIGADRTRHIFTRPLDRPEAQMVPGTEGANTPIWSPDSRSLAFGRANGLFRSDLDGNPPRRLASTPETAASVVTGAWSPRGVIVFQSIGAGLSQVSDTGGTPTPVTTLDGANGEISHSSPWFLPDGRRLMFLALAANQIRGVIWAVGLDDPTRTRLVESTGGAAYADGWLLTTIDGPRTLHAQRFDADRLMVGGAGQPVRDRLGNASTAGRHGFSVSSTGVLVVDRPPAARRQLTWLDRSGRTIATVGPAGGIREFSLAPDEQRAAANLDDEQGGGLDLWVFSSDQPEGTRLTYGSVVSRPMWSSDGRVVHFTGRPNMELRSLKVGSSEPERFENPGGFVHFEDVTSDGRYLLFKTSFAATTEIWLQRVDDPSQRRALVKSPFPASQARVSPNGRWLTYTLNLPGGPQIFIQPFDRPGERMQVSRTGGTSAVWRGDSVELYYEGRDGLTAVGLSEQGGSPVIGAAQTLFGIRTQGLTVNQPHNIAVAANGQKFLVNAIVGDSDNVPLEVTLNWTTGLKK